MDTLLEHYQELLGLEKAQFFRIDHDNTVIAIVYKVLLPDQTPLILKLCSKEKHFYRGALLFNQFRRCVACAAYFKNGSPF